jgi:hypothetical protein
MKPLFFVTGFRIIDGMAKKKLPPDVLQYFIKMGQKGGQIGGKARAEKLTAEERRESARKAVLTRWAKQRERTS